MGIFLSKRSLVILAISFLISASLFSQDRKPTPYYPERYQLVLPDEWMKRPKVLKAINEILPQTIGELKDRDFCTQCKAGYKVTLYTDSVEYFNEITSAPTQVGREARFTCSFDYRFYAALLVSDSSGKAVTMLRLNDANEILTWSKVVTATQQNGVYRYENIMDTTGTRLIGRRVIEEAPPVLTDAPTVNARSVLTPSFILRICELRIYEIEKTLRKLN